MILYMASLNDLSIEQVKVDRITKFYVFISGKRKSIVGKTFGYFKTRKKAKDFLLMQAKEQVLINMLLVEKFKSIIKEIEDL